MKSSFLWLGRRLVPTIAVKTDTSLSEPTEELRTPRHLDAQVPEGGPCLGEKTPTAAFIPEDRGRGTDSHRPAGQRRGGSMDSFFPRDLFSA